MDTWSATTQGQSGPSDNSDNLTVLFYHCAWIERTPLRRIGPFDMTIPVGPHPRVLILTIPHGAAHQRVAAALKKALLKLRPGLTVEIVDALARCAWWFRLYYDSYEIPLKYWPELWGWIESKQHSHTSTGPGWLYRRGGEPLFEFIEQFSPDIVLATEVGTCELAAMH